MQGFNPQKVVPNVDYVRALLKDEEIYSFYIPGIKFNTYFSSPIGEKDNVPSFSVFWSYRYNKFMFKEFRYGYFGDVYDLVGKMFLYNTIERVCMRILRDFGLDDDFFIDEDIAKIKPSRIYPYKKVSTARKSRATLRVVIRKWLPHDLDFWKKFGIDEKWLKRGSVFPISFFYLNGRLNKAEKYAYVYIERKDGNITYKIYQPFSKENKWLSNNDTSVWELWDVLPPSHKFLIITKSRKDALSIMATCRIPSTSLQAEGNIPKPQVIQELKERFKHIFLLYDNDYEKNVNWGLRYVTKLSESFGIDYLLIPEEYKSKDYSELVNNIREEKARKFLFRAIKKKLIEYDINKRKEE